MHVMTRPCLLQDLLLPVGILLLASDVPPVLHPIVRSPAPAPPPVSPSRTTLKFLCCGCIDGSRMTFPWQ